MTIIEFSIENYIFLLFYSSECLWAVDVRSFGVGKTNNAQTMYDILAQVNRRYANDIRPL
jgi:hypothetical protein